MTEEATAQLDLNGEFTAVQLDNIIAELAKMRASMQPAVPSEPPTALDQEVLVQEDVLFKVRTLIDGGIRVWLRNEGLGWLAFTLSPTQRAEFSEFLAKKAGHTHTAH